MRRHRGLWQHPFVLASFSFSSWISPRRQHSERSLPLCSRQSSSHHPQADAFDVSSLPLAGCELCSCHLLRLRKKPLAAFFSSFVEACPQVPHKCWSSHSHLDEIHPCFLRLSLCSCLYAFGAYSIPPVRTSCAMPSGCRGHQSFGSLAASRVAQANQTPPKLPPSGRAPKEQRGSGAARRACRDTKPQARRGSSTIPSPACPKKNGTRSPKTAASAKMA